MIEINTEGWKWGTGLIGIELEFPVHGDCAADTLSDCGIEVDYVDYNHDVYDSTVIKHDSSCGINGDPGCELVSPPITLASLINNTGHAAALREAWVKLSDGYIQRPKDASRCGIHIHVGVESDRDPSSDLIRLRLDRLWRAYSARSASIVEFCGDGRDPAKSGHARRYCGAHLALSDKYGQVNASPLMSGRQNTVEFRQLGMTRMAQEPNAEPFVPKPVPDEMELLKWYGYLSREVESMDPDFKARCLGYARENWFATQDEQRSIHERGSQVHTQLGWGDIVEWAIFVVLLTEGVCHTTGWIAKQRKLIGETRPDGLPWSDFWDRPALPYEEPGVDVTTQWSHLQRRTDPGDGWLYSPGLDDEPQDEPFPEASETLVSHYERLLQDDLDPSDTPFRLAGS